ncbi:cytochrome P450, putative [Ricinus communis]|uniref:Cytochrome P450, putative n=1 Tax=Ricinus communis TaxID=3988 RepID=B9RAR6_RICCO|nr:cytochrome P450, putative [Ricinus communis]
MGKFNGQDFELIPFGVGRRGCPGMNLGVMLIELALANLLYCHDRGLPDGIRIEDMDMQELLALPCTRKIIYA